MIRYIDLFCGIGSFHQALTQLNVGKCVFACDIDKSARKYYYKNHSIHPKKDITKIAASDIPKHDILCAGFPCQPFSISGKRKGFNEIRGTLFFDIVRIIKYHSPKVLILENVEGLKNHDGGRTYRTIISMLIDCGYDCYSQVLNASHYGVPQARKRLFIVCFLSDLGLKYYSFPKKLKIYNIVKDILLPEKRVILKNTFTLFHKVVQPGLFGKYCRKIKIIGRLKRLDGERRNGMSSGLYSIFAHAPTLMAGNDGDGQGAFYIENKGCLLTINEMKLLMGFPKKFILPKSRTKAVHLLGNSIVVPVVVEIIKSILSLKIKRLI